jgi:hypothetical protein
MPLQEPREARNGKRRISAASGADSSAKLHRSKFFYQRLSYS